MDYNNDTDLSEIRKMLYDHMKSCYPNTEKSFELWFTYLKLVYLDSERADFVCDTKIKYNVLVNNYMDFIKQCLEDVIGYLPEVTITVDPSVAPPNPYSHNPVLESLSSRKASAKDTKTYPIAGDYGEDYDNEGEAGFETGGTNNKYGMSDKSDKSDTSVSDDTDGTSDTDTLSDADGWSHPAPPVIESTDDRAAKSAEKPAPPTHGDNFRAYIRDYTFENFIVGSSNQLAHACAMNVADNVGTMVNPLFIWGPSGLGKTHLMYAIANRALSHNPDMKIICIKGEEFTNQLVEAIRRDKNSQFRQKYRSCDMLMIDDIQFIAGKEATQTEFFHTFDALYEDKKQIILTSDRPPRELESLEQRIRSRFEQGLLADIKPPDYELRLAILRNKINQNRVDVPTDVVDFLAQNLQENIRQLEGVIKKLAMTNLLTGQQVNMEMVINTVPEYLRDAEPVSDTIDRIIECVSRRYNVPVEEIMGRSRKKETKTARNVAMYVVRAVTGASLPQIGTTFDRDHATVHSNISMVESEIASDPVYEATINEILKEVKRS